MASDLSDDHVEPINILAELVIDSANDVLTGYQTWEDHISYLKQMAVEYELQGVKLPLDLTEERSLDNHDTDTYEANRRSSLPQSTRTNSRSETAKKLPDPVKSVRSRSLFD